MRIPEVCGVSRSGLNLETGWLLVRGERKREQELPIRNGFESIPEAYTTEVKPKVASGCERLLVSYVGKPLHPGPLRKSFARYARRARAVPIPHPSDTRSPPRV
ncbi:MAG: hypothetical protein CEE40_07640 [Chloroflexi bacterium B3_Chlor]|nr:MAG: hypothetical protein CEE40_07640 [Chloroflexi bacterium B3_Chlor]